MKTEAGVAWKGGGGPIARLKQVAVGVLFLNSSRIKFSFAPMQRRSSFWLFRVAAAAEPLTRNPGKIRRISPGDLLTGLLLAPSRLPELGAKTKHAGGGEGRRHLHQPEEGMMLHTALPEMFAGLPRRSLEPVRAFLVIFIPDSQHEIFPLEVNLANSRPEVVSHFGSVPKDDDTAGGEAQKIFYVVLALINI